MACVWGEHRLNVLSGFLHLLFHVCRGLSLLYSALQGGGGKGKGVGLLFLFPYVADLISLIGQVFIDL